MMSCYKDLVLQNAAVATGVGTAIDLLSPEEDYDWLVIHVRGITTATVTFQATVDGTNWFGVSMHNLAATSEDASVATATADGAFRMRAEGLLKFRANITSWTSGTIYVTALAS